MLETKISLLFCAGVKLYLHFYGIIFSCSYSRHSSLAHTQWIISEAATMPGVSAPLLWLPCCGLFKVVQKVIVRLNSMDCFRSDYTAQTVSLVLKKIPRGNEDEPRVILISALTLVYKYWEIQSRGSGWNSLFHTAFHLLTGLIADCAFNNAPLKKPWESQPNLLPANGIGIDRWLEGTKKERPIHAKRGPERNKVP